MCEKNVPENERHLVNGRGKMNNTSDTDSIITAAARQPIERLLPRGAENAISTSTLVEMTGAKSARILQQMIAAERERGALILSTSKGRGGYFRPSLDHEKGRAETEEFISQLKSRALNTLKALRSARQSLRKQTEQLEMQGW